MLEFLVEFILEAIFSFPGAGLRWLYHRGKIPYKKLLKEDFTYNAGAFILFASVFLFVFLFIQQYPELSGQ